MARAVATLPLLLVLAMPAAATAQGANRWQVGASVAVDGGARGVVPSGSIPSVSGLAGVRIVGGWSAELEAERAFRTTSRSSEAVWISLAPPDASREEIERLGIRARFDRSEQAGPGLTALATWRTRAPGRLNGALSVGVSARQFQTRVVRTITAVPTGYSLIDPRWPNDDSTRRRTGSGLTIGGMLITSLTSRVSIAPEVRFTGGFISGDDPYRVFRAGVRLMWRP